MSPVAPSHLERVLARRRAAARRTLLAMIAAQAVIFPLVVWLAPAPGERGRMALGLGVAFALMLTVNLTVTELALRRLGRIAAEGEALAALRSWLARRERVLGVLRFSLAGLAAVFGLRAVEDPRLVGRALWAAFALAMIVLAVVVHRVALPRVRDERAGLEPPRGAP